MTQSRFSLFANARGFYRGFIAPWSGVHFLARNRGLWPSALAPLLLNLLIAAGLAMLLIYSGASIFSRLHPAIGEAWWRWPVEVMAGIFFAIAAVGVLIAAWFVAQSVLCVWFYDRLARKVERLLGLAPGEMQDVPLGPQMTDALVDSLVLLGINLACLAVQFLPVVGTVLGACVSCYFTCSTLGYAYFDYPLSLRGLRRKDKLQFVRRHRAHSLGLGAAAMFLAFVPVVNAVFLTSAVVGGVMLYREARETSDVG